MGPADHHIYNTFENEPKECPTRPSSGAIACMINSEIGAVLAVMRRNVRWGVRYVADDDQPDHTLIHSLKQLRKQIFSWQHEWYRINPAMYLQPFLDVIQSDETGAPITGVALSSIYKILTLDILDLHTVNVGDAMHLIVDAVTSCRFEVTDPGSEEVVLMKILQVLLACMKSKASAKLSNNHVCNIVNTCFRVVHQASSKGELLQRIARHTMHELVRCIFSHLPDVDRAESGLAGGSKLNALKEVMALGENHMFGTKQLDNGSSPTGMQASDGDDKARSNDEIENAQNNEKLMMDPFGVPCMVEILHFLCSLLNVVDHVEFGPRSNPIAYDEDVPLFALGLINSAIELAGPSISKQPKLLAIIQDELFFNLMQFGLSMSPLILSTVCSIVLNLYHILRHELKIQLEAFFSCVLLKLAQSKHGSSYQRQEVAMEALVDLCRQKTFVTEIYANFDCDITCNNVFEELSNLLSKSAFPVNEPLSAIHILALDGLISLIHGMAERVGNEIPAWEEDSEDLEGYQAFWIMKCENYNNPNYWVPFLRKIRNLKKRLMVGADHFNRDPKKGLEFLQGLNLLPDKLDPQSVACLYRYTPGLDKNLVGDFLGNHDEFCIQVLHDFARTFDFRDKNLDTALRLFLGTFRLPGESQKIQRVLEAFSERYYEQSPHILINKDAALLLSYSIIMLNTDRHNAQVKKKMTEEDFIRNNRCINGGNDLPREFLSELYHSICENEIQMIPDQSTSSPMMTSSRWINVLHKSKTATPYIVCDTRALLDYDMFAILSGPTIAAMSVVFGQVDQEDLLKTCIDGFLDVAKIAASYHFDNILDDLVVSICNFTTLLAPLSLEEAIIAFGDDTKAKMATSAVFTIANRYSDYIHLGWKNVLDCVLSLHKLGLLPTHLASDAVIDLDPSSEIERSNKPAPSNASSSSNVLSMAAPWKSSGLMGRFSQLLSFDMEEPKSQPTEEELEAQKRIRETVQNFHIDSIFTESKFLQADSLLQLVKALILAGGGLRKGINPVDDEEIAVFCLELLITITLNNRDRIMLVWQGVYEHIYNIVQSTVMPCTLVEKAVFGLLKICQRLLPYKENLTDELLRSLQLVLKLDARVADAYCEPITQEVMRLVKANATHIRSHVGWRTIISLLSITARHPEASEVGFETLTFIMSDGTHLMPSNYVLCIDAAQQFAESRVGEIDQSISAVDLMAGSVVCLVRWSLEAKNAPEASDKLIQDIGEMWLKLVQGLRKVCLDPREEVRNHAILMLQRSLVGVDSIRLQDTLWLQCFDLVIFALLDDLLEIAQGNSIKDYRNMEGSLFLAIKLMSKVFLQLLQDLWRLPSFCKLWLGVLNRMERYMKVKPRGKRNESIQELVPELLKNTLFVMKTTGILVPSDVVIGDSFWQLTWMHVKNISPSLQTEVFPSNELEASQKKSIKTGGISVPEEILVQSSETKA